MFFYVSKIVDRCLEPLNAVVLVQLAGLILLLAKKETIAKALLAASTATILMIAVFPVATLVTRPLEQWMPASPALPERIDGIVLLGGGQDAELTQAYGKPTGSPETMAEFVALARRFPDAKLVVSGGWSSISRPSITAADVISLFVSQQGIDARRLIIQKNSRNTFEDAAFARKIVKPKLGESWILITTALHMPRSILVFRRMGWDVQPDPVGYRFAPQGYEFTFDASEQFAMLRDAVHEWLGLLAYKATGKI